jgi:hypothetical protein
MKKLPTWLPFAAFGPITGPLTYRLARSLEARRPVLAALYIIAILAVCVALPLVTFHLWRGIAAH